MSDPRQDDITSGPICVRCRAEAAESRLRDAEERVAAAERERDAAEDRRPSITALHDRVARLEEALRLATCEGKGYWTANGIRQDMPDKIAKLVRAALAQVEGKNG